MRDLWENDPVRAQVQVFRNKEAGRWVWNKDKAKVWAEERVTAEVEVAAEEALESRRTKMPSPEDAVQGVYAEPRPREQGGNGRDRATPPRPERPSRGVSGRSTRKLTSPAKRRLS